MRCWKNFVRLLSNNIVNFEVTSSLRFLKGLQSLHFEVDNFCKNIIISCKFFLQQIEICMKARVHINQDWTWNEHCISIGLEFFSYLTCVPYYYIFFLTSRYQKPMNFIFKMLDASDFRSWLFTFWIEIYCILLSCYRPILFTLQL